MSTNYRLETTLIAALLTASCSGDSCREYSRFTCAQLEKEPFNVYVYPEKGDGATTVNEYFAGTTLGLGSCGGIARSFAAINHFEKNAEWSYICCLKTDDSECAEKHR